MSSKKLHAVSILSLLLLSAPTFAISRVHRHRHDAYATAQEKQAKIQKKEDGQVPINIKYNLGSNEPGNLEFSSPGGNFTSNLGGYIQADTVHFGADNTGLDNSTFIRHAKLSLSGSFYKHWTYALSYNFAAATSSQQLNNAYVGYTNGPFVNFTVGQFAPIFGLSNDDNATATTFLELPLAQGLYAPSYSVGASYMAYLPDVSLTLNGFYPGNHAANTGNDQLSYTSRIVYAPFHKNGRILHFGASFWHQSTDSTNSVTFTGTPEADSRNTSSLIDTGSIANSKYYNTYDAELAGEVGPWSASAEALRTNLKRTSGSKDLNFWGYYLTSSYFITGEHRTYNFPGGYFTGISKIQHSYGAWQVAARFSTLDLTDEDVKGGRQNDLTVGLNWYPVQQIELMLNYIRADAFPSKSASPNNSKDQATNIYAARIQIMF